MNTIEETDMELEDVMDVLVLEPTEFPAVRVTLGKVGGAIKVCSISVKKGSLALDTARIHEWLSQCFPGTVQ